MSNDADDEQQSKVGVAQPPHPLELAAMAIVGSCLNTINFAQQVSTESPILRGYLEASAAQAQMVLRMIGHARN